jgi:hypothetical protein
MEEHQFSAGTVQRIGNVLKITYTKQEVITLDDMKEVTKIREQIFGKEQYCSLIDLRADNLSLSSEAKKYVTQNKTIRQLRLAEVLLVNNFIEKMGVHAYVRIFRSGDNITVMTEEENALHWLNTQYERHYQSDYA